MDSRIEKSILFITNHFRSEIVLDDLAKEVHLSKFHFHRLFTEETGVTPLSYINKIKLEHASHFISMYPNAQQMDVAFESGYSSPSVFSRSFKKYYGVSPSAYKKKFGLKVNENTDHSLLDFPITYLGKQSIQVYFSNLVDENLASLYDSLIQKIDKPTTCFGVFVDTPFHKPLEECRYYAGFETDMVNKKGQSFEIEEGYYTFFEISGDFSSLFTQVSTFKEQSIDPSPYYISSLMAFEKIVLESDSNKFDYFSTKRLIYLKVKHK